jgi:hypothetical protein
MKAMSRLEMHLAAATGFLELGMFDDAAMELENIEPEERARPEVMGLRVELYHDAEKWTAMEAVARHMIKVHPQVPGWWIQWAFATRRAVSIESAMEILRDTENRSTQRTLHEHAP